MHKLVFVLALFLSAAVGARTLEPARQDRQPLTRTEPERAAKAQDLLTQTRAALGQNAKLEDVKKLSVNGKSRRLSYTASGSPTSFVTIGQKVGIWIQRSSAQFTRFKVNQPIKPENFSEKQ